MTNDAIASVEKQSSATLKRGRNLELSVNPSKTSLGRRGIERLDMLLLVVEALDLNAGEGMLWISNQLGFQDQFPNRVELWKSRCYNPLRRTTRRGQLAAVDTEALIQVLCMMADRLYPLLHQLLSSREPESLNKQRWTLLEDRLRDLLKERMNPRRGAVQRLLSSKDSENIFREYIFSLSLAAGPGGFDRLRASLLDPIP